MYPTNHDVSDPKDNKKDKKDKSKKEKKTRKGTKTKDRKEETPEEKAEREKQELETKAKKQRLQKAKKAGRYMCSKAVPFLPPIPKWSHHERPLTGPLKNAKIRTNWLINGKKCLDLGLRILFRAPAWLLFDTYDLRYIIMILAIGIQIQSHAPVPRPENMREAFTKDQKSAANNIALKRTALQAALDQNKDFFLACVWWAVDLPHFQIKKLLGLGFKKYSIAISLTVPNFLSELYWIKETASCTNLYLLRG